MAVPAKTKVGNCPPWERGGRWIFTILIQVAGMRFFYFSGMPTTTFGWSRRYCPKPIPELCPPEKMRPQKPTIQNGPPMDCRLYTSNFFQKNHTVQLGLWSNYPFHDDHFGEMDVRRKKTFPKRDYGLNRRNDGVGVYLPIKKLTWTGEK